MNLSKQHKAQTSRRLATVAALALGIAGSTSALSQSSDAERIAKARQAASALAADLKKNLEEALRVGGPIGALDVCRAIAPAAAEAQSAAHGMAIKRTAIRVRNPANAPDGYERRVLEDFLKKIAEGSNPAELEHVGTVTEGSTATFRYMKPIMMAEKPCSACHGASIAPEVSAKIKELYPSDAATGFLPGELRGAFSITFTLPSNP